MEKIFVISRYFPDLSSIQKRQFLQLETCYRKWNALINVISRKDIDNLYEHHILHSLSIAKIISLTPGTKVLDVGSGGGFPGIPMAIYHPHVHFCLIDSVGKKIKVINEVLRMLRLTNVEVRQCRAEKVTGQYNFVVSRAVSTMKNIYQWTQNNITRGSTSGVQHGMLCLKGGDLQKELIALERSYHIYSLSDFFSEPFFEQKKMVHVPVL